MLKAGFDKRCITPPIGAPLAGFAARQGGSTGVHDELYARALVLDDGAKVVAIVSVDVLGLPAAFVERVRGMISARTPITPDGALITCTHTHAAAITIRTFFNPEESVDAAYMDSLAHAIADAVTGAFESRVPARAGCGTGRVTGLGVNRRTPSGTPVDEQVGILRVDGEDGRPRAVLVNYACHPTVLGPDNLLATGDFPATTIERLERALGPDAFAMYLNGTQGNVGPGHSSELSAIGVIAPGRTFERAAEIGDKLARAVLDALRSIPTRAEIELGAASIPLSLPLKTYPPPHQAAERLEAARQRLARLDPADPEYQAAKSQALYASIENYYASETVSLNGSLPVELQGIRAGETSFIGLPAEVFVEIGLRAKRSARRQMFLAGLANGYIGYLPGRDAFPSGGYEVISSQVNQQAEDRLVEGILELERRLFPSS